MGHWENYFVKKSDYILSFFFQNVYSMGTKTRLCATEFKIKLHKVLTIFLDESITRRKKNHIKIKHEIY